MPDHYDKPIDPNLMAMLMGQGNNMFGLSPEFSASKGAYMPTDIGSLSSSYNVMQDQLQLLQDPLVLMMLGMTGGPQFGMVPNDDGIDDGRNFLTNVISQYGEGGMSPEAFIADRILNEGETPAQAIKALEIYGDEEIEFSDGSTGKRSEGMFTSGAYDAEEWIEIANDYSNRLMSDRAPTMKPGAGMQAALDMGIDTSGQYTAAQLNPNLESAAQEYERVRAEYDELERPAASKSNQPGSIFGSAVGRALGNVVREDGGPKPRKPRTQQAVRDVVPRLGAARRALQGEGGIAAARQQFARESGANPMRDQLQAMLGFIGREARGM